MLENIFSLNLTQLNSNKYSAHNMNSTFSKRVENLKTFCGEMFVESLNACFVWICSIALGFYLNWLVSLFFVIILILGGSIF